MEVVGRVLNDQPRRLLRILRRVPEQANDAQDAVVHVNATNEQGDLHEHVTAFGSGRQTKSVDLLLCGWSERTEAEELGPFPSARRELVAARVTVHETPVPVD